MVHRLSHSVRFSGLGLSFHLSSSHSQPWRGDIEEKMVNGTERFESPREVLGKMNAIFTTSWKKTDSVILASAAKQNCGSSKDKLLCTIKKLLASFWEVKHLGDYMMTSTCQTLM